MRDVLIPRINTVELSSALLRSSCALDLKVLEQSYAGIGNAKLEVFINRAARQLVSKLRTYLLQKEFVEKRQTISYPTTAWDAVKNALPPWIKRYFKINFTTHIVSSHYKICPHMAVPEDQYSHCCLSWISEDDRS